MILSNEIGKSTVSVVDNEGRTALISSCVELHDDESGRNETSEWERKKCLITNDSHENNNDDDT